MNRTCLSLILVLLITPAVVHASDQAPVNQPVAGVGEPERRPVRHPSAPAVPPAEAAYYEREAELARQKRLLDLEMEILERQQKLAGAGGRRTDASGGGGSTVISRASAPSSSSTGSSSRVATPRPNSDLGFTIVSIWGPDEALQAQILSHGLRLTVRQGDTLTNGWVVDRVARTGLVITKGRARRTVMIGG